MSEHEKTMKRLSRTLFPVVFLMFVVSAVRAQDLDSLRQTAEELVKTENPHRTLIRKYEQDKRVTYLWGIKGNEKSDLRLTIFYGESEQEAAEEMRALINRLSVGPGEKITGYGEQAYMWKSPSGGFVVIRFREANVFVDLSGPSVAFVEDLAKKLADHVKK